jgi:NTP pyrophosphatase (non-canonical NTP hydrolase)
VHIREFQQLIDRMYSDKDRRRGPAKTFLWLTEEVGELAWLVTLANVEGVDLERAIKKFTGGCPGCGEMVCRCDAKLTD